MAKKYKKPTVYTGADGKQVTLLNPHLKCQKAFRELQNNARYTNDGQIKTDRDGNVMTLSDTQKAYRSGFIQAFSDNAKCFKAIKAKKANKKN